MAAVKRRRALSQAPDALRSEGDATRAARLLHAWQAQSIDPGLTHGFHAYPARMHGSVAAACVQALGEALGDRLAGRPLQLLDPFCGSGTVLLEAMRAGHAATGVDLNPLALRIAALQCQAPDAATRRMLAAQLQQVTQRSLERVRERQEVRATLPAGEARWYPPHVLKELAGLFAEIEALPQEESREAFRLVFSALLVKFSYQESLSKEQTTEKRLRKGLVSEFFERKGHELLLRWQALQAAMPKSTQLQLKLGDARQLPTVLGQQRFDALLSSPPYGGTYDYAQHHARSLAWLGIDARHLQQREIGARRHLQGDDAAERWQAQLGTSLQAMRRVAQPHAQAILLLGDAQFGRQRLAADLQVRQLAPTTGWTLLAQASQRRRDWTGGRAREEHLLWLQASPGRSKGC